MICRRTASILICISNFSNNYITRSDFTRASLFKSYNEFGRFTFPQTVKIDGCLSFDATAGFHTQLFLASRLKKPHRLINANRNIYTR